MSRMLRCYMVFCVLCAAAVVGLLDWICIVVTGMCLFLDIRCVFVDLFGEYVCCVRPDRVRLVFLDVLVKR